ncbi:hypothetical protein C8R46DRAFT_1344629 [Mycena filopes]|nr:hypothetical protein C8R46DRAFT_1344629 [Mycena filopes]
MRSSTRPSGRERCLRTCVGLRRVPCVQEPLPLPGPHADPRIRSHGAACAQREAHAVYRSMEPYRKVPVSWNVALSIVLLAVFIALAATGKLYLPLYTVFIALGVDALLVVCLCGVWLAPFSVVYFHGQVLNELLYGYVIDARGSRPPVGLLSYHTILGQCWYEAYSMFSDTKLGHHVVNTKGRFLDPNKQWTVRFISRTNQGIAFGLVGPKKLFADPMHVRPSFVLSPILVDLVESSSSS